MRYETEHADGYFLVYNPGGPVLGMASLKLKEQILADLPVKSVDIVSCRGLTSFYAMEKGLIVGY